jgi:hypothetical protein
VEGVRRGAVVDFAGWGREGVTVDV